jgi:hypothetical protein
MSVAPESVEVGKCYLTDVARVQRVIEITPAGEVIHEHRSTRERQEEGIAGTATLRAFAFITVREVLCHWTPESDDAD